ncbi:unnamed protein product [Heterobilharzia americana]|nr:unnamed protein product [Heterobilharzia americana]
MIFSFNNIVINKVYRSVGIDLLIVEQFKCLQEDFSTSSYTFISSAFHCFINSSIEMFNIEQLLFFECTDLLFSILATCHLSYVRCLLFNIETNNNNNKMRHFDVYKQKCQKYFWEFIASFHHSLIY